MNRQFLIGAAFAVISAAALARQGWVSWTGRRGLRAVGGNENVFLRVEIANTAFFVLMLIAGLWLMTTA